MASVVPPHSTAAATPSASPHHWRGLCGDEKPSANANATAPKASTSPAHCRRDSASPCAIQGMPSATTKGER